MKRQFYILLLLLISSFSAGCSPSEDNQPENTETLAQKSESETEQETKAKSQSEEVKEVIAKALSKKDSERTELEKDFVEMSKFDKGKIRKIHADISILKTMYAEATKEEDEVKYDLAYKQGTKVYEEIAQINSVSSDFHPAAPCFWAVGAVNSSGRGYWAAIHLERSQSAIDSAEKEIVESEEKLKRCEEAAL